MYGHELVWNRKKAAVIAVKDNVCHIASEKNNDIIGKSITKRSESVDMPLENLEL